MNALLAPFRAVGQAVIGTLEFLGGMGYLLRDTVAYSRQALLGTRGRRLGWANLWAQMERVGVRSIPIVSLVLFCIGAILALQMAPTLRQFGVVHTVPDIIAIAVFRELGPLVSAIVLTGFAGASIAAEMGTMVVSEEIEALEAHAINPIRFLVVPRVLATTVMMVCIAVVGDLMGMVGGLIVSQFVLEINYRQFITHTFDMLTIKDFLTGLAKAGVFGTIISSLACYLGLSVTGGAQGVGVATTRTVVLTIVALIFVDLLFTGVFYFLGL
jgi:phospholipid/cholesterol/gamma-HCH transport system permease protein